MLFREISIQIAQNSAAIILKQMLSSSQAGKRDGILSKRFSTDKHVYTQGYGWSSTLLF